MATGAERGTTDAGRRAALDAALGQLDRQYGRGTIMRLGDSTVPRDIEAIPTGSLGLDAALGIGGLPRGRVVEIYGPESSGKTTLSLEVIAQAQRKGGTAAFVDAEHALDPGYAEKIGLDIDDLLVSQPDTGEQALEITDTLVRSGAVDVVVIDSVAALTPKAEIEGEMGDSHVGLQARLMSQALRKLTANIKRSNTLVIFINQIRMKIGVMFGSPETTTGGNALKFYASVRLDIRRIGAIKKGDEVIGNETRVKIVKNKIAPPFKNVQFDILYGEGVSRHGELLDYGVAHGLVEKSGAWYGYGSDRIGQGRDNARRFLREHPDTADAIEAVLRERMIPVRDSAAARRGRGGGRGRRLRGAGSAGSVTRLPRTPSPASRRIAGVPAFVPSPRHVSGPGSHRLLTGAAPADGLATRARWRAGPGDPAGARPARAAGALAGGAAREAGAVRARTRRGGARGRGPRGAGSRERCAFRRRVHPLARRAGERAASDPAGPGGARGRAFDGRTARRARRRSLGSASPGGPREAIRRGGARDGERGRAPGPFPAGTGFHAAAGPPGD